MEEGDGGRVECSRGGCEFDTVAYRPRFDKEGSRNGESFLATNIVYSLSLLSGARQ